MSNKWQDFKYFGWDEPNPIGKYKQPMENPRFTDGQGYESDELDRMGTKTYGRWVRPLNGDKKERLEIRGCKNTTRGKHFYEDHQERDQVRTKPRPGAHKE